MPYGHARRKRVKDLPSIIGCEPIRRFKKLFSQNLLPLGKGILLLLVHVLKLSCWTFAIFCTSFYGFALVMNKCLGLYISPMQIKHSCCSVFMVDCMVLASSLLNINDKLFVLCKIFNFAVHRQNVARIQLIHN